MSERKLASAVQISVILPCLNEAATVATCVEKAARGIRNLRVTGEVLVADNGSNDGSQAVARASGARVVDVTAPGYGNALMGGLDAARGNYVVMADADDSYDLSELRPFVEKLDEGYDLVVGNRFLGGIHDGAMPALHKYVGNPLLSGLGRLFFGSQCGDFHCGLRAFRRDAILGLDLQTTGMEFASEMVVKATINNLRIAEVPTTLARAGRDRPPHLRTWRDGWRHLRFLFLYSPRWLFLYPGAALMVLGVSLGGWLMPGPRHLGHVVLDTQTLLASAAAVIVGFQSVLFAVFTKQFAIRQRLLPEDPRFRAALRYVTLEVGLFTGGALLVSGLAGSSFAFAHWSSESFGPLNASSSLRVVIPSLTAVILGSQIVLSSFFLSVLRLARR